jgi:anti-anti-sigma factor
VGPAPFQASASELDGGISLLEVNGELDLSTATQLEGPLEEAVNSPKAAVLIDLTDCTFIDSTGIALIVRGWQKLEGNGNGHLAICSPTEQVRRVLDVSGLDQSIPVHPSRDDGVAALRG